MKPSTVGSVTSTLEADAERGVLSRCNLRYSSSVVALMACSSLQGQRAASALPVHGAGAACGEPAPTMVQPVDEQMMRPSFQSFNLSRSTAFKRLPIAAILRAGHHRAQVERHDIAAFSEEGTSPATMLSHTLDEAVCAGARLADEHGVVLLCGATAPDGAADSLGARLMTGSSLAFARLLREVLP